MLRKEDHPLQKVTLNLFEGDFARLQVIYPRPGAAKIIRDLVRRHLRAHEEHINRRENRREATVRDLPIDIQDLTDEERDYKVQTP